MFATLPTTRATSPPTRRAGHPRPNSRAPVDSHTYISPIVYDKLLFDYLREHKWTVVAFAVVVLFTLPVESVLLPRFYSRMFNGIRQAARVGGGSSGDLVGDARSLWKSFTTQPVGHTFLVIAGIWVVVLVAYVLKNTLATQIVPSYLSFVRQRLFASTVEKHSNRYKDIRVGEEVTRIMDVSRNIKNLFYWICGDLFPVYLTTLLLLGYLFWVNPVIGGVALVGIVLHSVVFVVMAKRNIDISATREHYYLQMSEKLHDSFGNLMNIYLNNMKSDEVAANNRIEAVHAELLVKQYKNTRNMVALMSLLAVLTFLVTIGATYAQAHLHRISATSFIAVWIIILLYLTYMIRLSDEMPHYITLLGILQCSNPFLTDILHANEPRAHTHTIAHGKVAFQDVGFTYPGASAPTLHKFNLTVQPHEKVGILGTSGSGKTTAMKLLSGMYQADVGLVQIDDLNILDYDIQHLRDRVNYVNQRTQLFNTTILKNIQYGNTASAESIGDLLKRYELTSVYSKLKNGVATSAGVHGGSLSLGMQKVTMLLRGLLRNGQVVILDEPLAGLDADTRKKVLRLIDDKCKGRTLIVITHDKEIIPMMDRTVNLGELNHTESYRSGDTIGAEEGAESAAEWTAAPPVAVYAEDDPNTSFVEHMYVPSA